MFLAFAVDAAACEAIIMVTQEGSFTPLRIPQGLLTLRRHICIKHGARGSGWPDYFHSFGVGGWHPCVGTHDGRAGFEHREGVGVANCQGDIHGGRLGDIFPDFHQMVW